MIDRWPLFKVDNAYQTTIQTTMKWLRRFDAGFYRPVNQPNKISGIDQLEYALMRDKVFNGKT